MAKPLTNFTNGLQKAKTEEDVKSVFAKYFDITYDTSEYIDLYTPQVLFEFKFDKNLSNIKQLATALAQNLYYVRRLKFGITAKPIPPVLCLATREFAVLAHTADWKTFYTDENNTYDWDLAPSSPDKKLVEAITQSASLNALHVHVLSHATQTQVLADLLVQKLTGQGELVFGDKKVINEANFEEVYAYWNEIFGESVRNGFKSSRYFVNDIQAGRTIVDKTQGKVLFQLDQGDYKEKKILTKDYEHFWSIYEKVSDADTVRGVLAKMDRLTDEAARRRHGEFYTPLNFSLKALDYLEQTLGKHWWHSGEYRLWDMAAGTGNLQYHLPAEAYAYCYLSTLDREDVEHCQKLFHGATIFQYDYLNEDIGNIFDAVENNTGMSFDFNDTKTWKLPEKLRADLANPTLKWIILINPPFATAQQGGAKGANKADVAATKVRSVMHSQNLGEVSRELFAQFLFRIKREFAGKVAWLGLFSKIKYINATNDTKLRNSIFRFCFVRGFMFSSVNFDGTSRASQFPVGFLLWNLSQEIALESQAISLDVFDEQVQKTGTKRISTEDKNHFLSKWIARPKGIKKYPPFSAAISVKQGGEDVRDRICDGFLGALMCAGNDLQHQNMTALFSGPYVSAGSHSITAEIFEKSLVVHAVRRLPKAAWHNDRDQFMAPKAALPAAFIHDCVLWSLFASSNQTAALKDVAYLGEVYQIPNHFFPFSVATLKTWQVSDSDIRLQLASAPNRFVADWLAQQVLSDEAQALLAAGEKVYQLYFAHLNQLRTPQFKIQTWDAGWWQVRNALDDVHLGAAELKAVKIAHAKLKNKLLPQVYQLGFLVA
jgi:hypothetical protein